MLKSRQNVMRLAYALLFVGIALLLIPPYKEYCEGAQSNNYYCAAYEIATSLGTFIEAHNGAFTALATAAVAWFTWTLWQSSEKMWDATSSALNLARQEFIASHRPLLKVKLVQLVEGENERAAINFTVVNVGKSNAYVIGSCAKADFFFPSAFPHPNDYGVNNVVRPRRFVSGATDKYTISTEQHRGLIEVYAEGMQTLRLYGYIVYKDASENVRTTYFCRAYDRDRDRFDPVDRPDYDSTD
jgi:hypothetical protein